MQAYRKKGLIGTGVYGDVYQAEKLGVNYAIKEMKIHEYEYDIVGVSQSVIKELDISSRLQHPNVISLHEAFHNQDGSIYFMVMELGDATIHPNNQYIWLPNDIDPEKIKYQIFQMFCGLAYVHYNNIIHGDIKPQNIIMMGETPKIADFGLAEYNIRGDNPLNLEQIVTLWYRPPELFMDPHPVTPAIDVWAMGCTVYEMITGNVLFPAKKYEEMEFYHNNSPYIDGDTLNTGRIGSKLPENDRSELADILRMCLNVNYKARITALEVTQLPYFNRDCNVSVSDYIPISIIDEDAMMKKWEGIRRDTVEWMYQANTEFKQHIRTFILGVNLFDRFMDVIQYMVQEEKIRGYASVCLLIASQLTENYGLELVDLEDLTKSDYKKEDLLGMKMEVLDRLHYRLYYPDLYIACRDKGMSENEMYAFMLDPIQLNLFAILS